MLRYRCAVRAVCAIVLGGVLCLVWPTAAQGQSPGAPPEHVHPAPAPEGAVVVQAHQHDTAATSLFSPREVSGTAWQPDLTPMYGWHRQTRGWEVMLHGNAFVQLLHESAPEHRGATQAGSINWVMAGARRPLGAGRVGLRTMMSLEPWTIPGCGYPNLLATGEFCDGESIHDKQHPHDLFMEVAADFDRPLTSSLRWQIYGGLAGEPALGPPGFPHRLSAMPNPMSPIGHHWMDATHISFGLITAGVYGTRWKAESSAFNGREPDESRGNIDIGPLDSVAGRLSFMPTTALAVQVSGGRLREAEMPDSGGTPVDLTRVTASAIYHRQVMGASPWATTLAWGANREDGDTTHSVMVESSLNLLDGHALFGRMEVGGKPAHDLHIHESHEVFTVRKLQAGYARFVNARRGLQPGIGATISAAMVPDTLQPRYGGVGVGIGVFLTVRPAVHQMVP